MASTPLTATLAEIAAETIKLLNEVKAIDHCSDDPGREWPRAQFAAESDRFEIWAVNLGVFVSGHGSLDYRVREAESLERTLRRFISDLNESLAEVLEYCSGSKQEDYPVHSQESSFDEFQKSLDDDLSDENTGETESDIELLLNSLRDPIDALYKLSTKIRNPSTRLASSKAQCHKQIDPESGFNLFDMVESFDYDYVSSLFLGYRKSKALGECEPSLPLNTGSLEEDGDCVWEPIRTVISLYQDILSSNNESFLVHRIARANVRRRQQFSYWRKHREKLTQHAVVITKPDIPTETGPISNKKDVSIQLVPQISTQSVTTASRLNIPQIHARDDRSTISVSEYAPSAWKPGKEIVGFPDPPKQEPEARFFECPFCFTLCSVDVLAQKAWRAHLVHDLRPYICTYENCRNPDQQYDSRRDWIAHENSAHQKVWRCPENSAQFFPNLERFKAHLRSDHANHDRMISENQLILAGESALINPNRCCPVCQLTIETTDALNSHIALHLERFAIFSLPRSTDDKNEDDVYGSANANLDADGSRDGDFDSDSRDNDFDSDGDHRPNTESIPPETGGGKSDIDIKEAREKLASKKSTLGPEHPDALECMNNLVGLFMSQGKFTEAESLCHETLQLMKKVLGEEHPDTLVVMHDLSMVSINQGKYAEAESLCHETLQLMKKVLGEEHPNTLVVMHDLSIIFINQGRYKEAEELCREALQLKEKILGKEHFDTLISMDSLASIFADQGKHIEAEKLCRETLQLKEKILGEEHPDTLRNISNLAGIFTDQGKYAEAESLYRQTLERRERVLGEEHPDTLRNMSSLASILANQGKYTEAELFYRQTLQLKEESFGREDPDTLKIMDKLAAILANQDKFAEAESLYYQTLERREKVLGEEHPDTLRNMSSLASILANQSKYEEAESLYRQISQLRKITLGENHRDTLMSKDNLADILANQSKYTEAEPLYRQTLQLREESLGREDPDTLKTMQHFANILMMLKKHDEADHYFHEIRQIEGKREPQ